MTPEMGPEALLDHLSTAVLGFDEHLRACYINAAGQDLLGLSERQACGLALDALFPADGALVAGVRRAWEADRSCLLRDVSLHLPHLQRTVAVDCRAARLGERYATRLLLELVNAEGRERAEREASLLTQQQVSHALLGGLAHEVKNPLGGIRGAAQLLARELTHDDLTEYTRVIIDETDRLDQLVTRMLGPNGQTRHALLNIHEILERVRQLVLVAATGRLDIVRDYDPSLPSLWGDRDQLLQAFLNLIKNAAEAVGGQGSITLRTRPTTRATVGESGHRLVLRVDVIDNGPGVPEHIREGVFYPMVTGNAGGSGLGLPIAQSLIHRHGGFIEFESQPGETRFTVWLPVREAQ